MEVTPLRKQIRLLSKTTRRSGQAPPRPHHLRQQGVTICLNIHSLADFLSELRSRIRKNYSFGEKDLSFQAVTQTNGVWMNPGK